MKNIFYIYYSFLFDAIFIMLIHEKEFVELFKK